MADDTDDIEAGQRAGQDILNTFRGGSQTVAPTAAPPEEDQPGEDILRTFGGGDIVNTRHRQRSGQRELNEWRERVANSEENTLSWAERHLNPFRGMKNDAAFARANERMRQGRHEPGDAELIATQERLHQLDEGASTGEQIGGAVLGIPALVAQGMVGGAALRGAGAIAGRLGATGVQGVLGGGAIGGAGAGLAGRAGGVIARGVASTPFIPSLYGQRVIQENVENGRDALDIRGVPAPMALAAIQNTIFGSVGQYAQGVGGRGVGGVLARGALRTGAGVGEQQIADIVTSAAGLDTGYGVIGDLLQGHGDRALQHLTVQAATFAAFAGLHEVQHPYESTAEGRLTRISGTERAPGSDRARLAQADAEGNMPSPVFDAFQDSLHTLARQGVSREGAVKQLQLAFDAAMKEMTENPSISRTEALDAMRKLPEGPVRDLGMALVDAVRQVPVSEPGSSIRSVDTSPAPTGPIHEQIRQAPDRAAAMRIIDSLPEGSAKRMARRQVDMNHPEQAPAAESRTYPEVRTPESNLRTVDTSPTKPAEPQLWHNQGTDFQSRTPGNGNPDRSQFVGSDGKAYSIDHEDHPNSKIVTVHDSEGNAVASARALPRPDGKIDVHFQRNRTAEWEGNYQKAIKRGLTYAEATKWADANSKTHFLGAKGMGAQMHDYVDKTIGDIIHPEHGIGQMHTSEPALAIWRKNGELAAKQKATYASDNGPVAESQTVHPSGAPAQAGAGAQGSSGASPAPARPESAPVPSAAGETPKARATRELGALKNLAKRMGFPVSGTRANLEASLRNKIGNELVDHALTPPAVHVDRAIADPHPDNIATAVQAVVDDPESGISEERRAKFRRMADEREAKREAERDAKTVSDAEGVPVSETSLRHRVATVLQTEPIHAQVSHPGAGGEPGQEPGEGARPAEAPSGGQADNGANPPSAAGGGQAASNVVKLGDIDLASFERQHGPRATNNLLSRLAKGGDRDAAAVLSRRVNVEQPPKPPPEEGRPLGWEYWSNYQKQHYQRASSDWLKENVRLRNNGEKTLANEIIGRGGIDPKSLEGDLEHWKGVFGEGIFKVRGKKAQKLDVLAEELSRRFPGEFQDQSQHKTERVLQMLAEHYLEDGNRQYETLAKDSEAAYHLEKIRAEIYRLHPEKSEAQIESEAREALRRADQVGHEIGAREGGERSPVEVIREGDAYEPAGRRYEPEPTDPWDQPKPERGNPQPPAAPAAGPAGEPTGPERATGGLSGLLKGLVKGESGTMWVPSKGLLAEKFKQMVGEREAREPARAAPPPPPQPPLPTNAVAVTPNGKPQDSIINRVHRAFLLSNPKTMVKLFAASAERIAIAPLEETVGSFWSRIPGIAKIALMAPREGRGLNLATERQALLKGLTEGAADAWRTIRKGHSELDALYDPEKSLTPRTWLDFVGELHAAAKAPAVRAEYTRSLLHRMEQGAARGEDVTTPAAQARIGLEAYKDSQRAKFQQDNVLATKIKQFLTPGPNAGPGERALTTLGKVVFPIVKIPTNIVAEAFQYAFGTVTGGTRAALALRRGVENLKPAEAELIMRSLKKGSLGLAALGVGFLNPDIFGGFYSGRRDERDVEAGGIRTGWGTIPSYLLHNPFLEVFQVGATARRAMIPSRRNGHPDTVSAFAAGILGLAEEAPLVRGLTDVGHAFEPQRRGAYFGELAKSMTVPQLVQWLAGATDRNAQGDVTRRHPRTLIQHVEMGIPGLRQNVPLGR